MVTSAAELPSLVVFDLDNTFYNYSNCHNPALQAALKELALHKGMSLKQAESNYAIARKAVKSRLGSTGSSHSRILYFSELLLRLGEFKNSSLVLSLERIYWNHFFSNLKLREGASNLLETLEKYDVPTVLVTDFTAEIQMLKLEVLGLSRKYEIVITSELAGGDKVTLRPFTLLADFCPTSWLDYVWFVGDSPVDGPVDRLRERGIINDGEFWLLGKASSVPEVGIRTWETFSTISREISRLHLRT